MSPVGGCRRIMSKTEHYDSQISALICHIKKANEVIEVDITML